MLQLRSRYGQQKEGPRLIFRLALISRITDDLIDPRHTHDISLCSDSNKTVDVLTDRYQNLSSHVTTLLGSWGLIFNVNSSGTLLNEKSRKLHDCCKSSMASIGIGNYGPKVINVCLFSTLC